LITFHSYSSFSFTVLSNSQLVLNILSVNTPVNFVTNDVVKPTMNCLNVLSTIPEAISHEPSCSNLHDLTQDTNCNLDQQQLQQQSWCIYENDGNNSKSTDALLDDNDNNGSSRGMKYTNNISFSILKENHSYKSNSNSNCSISRAAVDLVSSEKPIVVVRSRSGSKNASKIYEPISSESLTDSQGYMDDFDESCALIAAENDRRKRMSSNDLIIKRNSLGVNKVPQCHRFSAGDADKLEKGIKSSLPSTRSLRDS
jgi:hypothetical protein